MTRTTRTTRTPRTTRWLPVLAGAALALSACGTPSAPTSSSAPSSAPVSSAAAPSSAASSAAPSPGVSIPADAAKIGDSIQYDDKVEVTITQVQTAGTTVTLTVEVDDQGPDDVTGPVDVQASYGSARTAAAPVDGGSPITAPVAAGKKVSGRYAFTIPSSGRSKVGVDVALGSDRDHAQFTGSVK